MFIRTVLSYLFFNGPVLSAHHQLPPSILFLHNFEALRGKGGQAREQGAQEDVARTKAKNDTVVISCHLLQFSNLPIQLVKIATGWPSMLLGSFHPKRLVFRHVRVHLRWIPLDDPISFHIAVATLVAVNSFVRVGSPVCVWRYPTQKIKSASKSIERWNRMDTG